MGYTVQKFMKLSLALLVAANHALLTTLVSLFVFFGSQKLQYLGSIKREERFSIRDKLHQLLHEKDTVHNGCNVNSADLNRPSLLDAAHQFVIILYSDHIASDTCNITLHRFLWGPSRFKNLHSSMHGIHEWWPVYRNGKAGQVIYWRCMQIHTLPTWLQSSDSH